MLLLYRGGLTLSLSSFCHGTEQITLLPLPFLFEHVIQRHQVANKQSEQKQSESMEGRKRSYISE